MASVPVFEKIAYNCSGGVIKDSQSVNLKSEVYCENVKRVINVISSLSCDKAEKTEKGVSYGGRINVIMCYEDDKGEIKKAECFQSFKKDVDFENRENCQIKSTESEILKTEIDLSGIKVCFNSTIKTDIYLEDLKTIELLSGGEEIIADTEEVTAINSLGEKQTNYKIEEEFELNYPVKEVIYHNAFVAITSSQCGVGSIIVDGELFVNLLLIKEGETPSYINEYKTFPFRAEIDCEEAMPACSSVAMGKVKSFKIDLTVNQEENTTNAEINAVLDLTGECFENRSVKICKDAFCLNQKINLERQTASIDCGYEVRGERQKVCGISTVEEFDQAEIIAVTNKKVEIVETEVLEDGVKVVG